MSNISDEEKKLQEVDLALNPGGHIIYVCGHYVDNSLIPQDQDWQSELPCEACENDPKWNDMFRKESKI